MIFFLCSRSATKHIYMIKFLLFVATNFSSLISYFNVCLSAALSICEYILVLPDIALKFCTNPFLPKEAAHLLETPISVHYSI